MKFQTAAIGEALCAAWNPDGKGEFLTGHSSGLIHAWSDKDPQPKDEAGGSETFELCEPVNRLEFYGVEGGSTILVHDGGPTALDPSVHHLTVCRGGKDGIGGKQRLSFNKDVLGFACIGNNSPWPQVLPTGLAVLVEGRLETVGISTAGGSGGGSAAAGPLACPRGIAQHGLEVQRSNICCTSVVSRIRGSLLASLKKLGARTAGVGYVRAV